MKFARDKDTVNIRKSNVVKKGPVARADLNDMKPWELTHSGIGKNINQAESYQMYPASMPVSDLFIGPIWVSYYHVISFLDGL